MEKSSNIFGLLLITNVIFMLVIGGDPYIYLLTLPLSLPINILIYYLLNRKNYPKSENTIAASKNESSLNDEKSIQQPTKQDSDTQARRNSSAFRLLISTFGAPLILIILYPVINTILESDSSGGFINMDGILTMIALLILYPIVVFLIYRKLPVGITLNKLSTLQRNLFITLIIIGLLSLLYVLVLQP